MNEVMYTGHGEKTGGLQQHSVGDSYPFMVVGCQHLTPNDSYVTEYTHYYVLDCSTGKKYYWQMPGSKHPPQTWSQCSDAHMVAEQLASDFQGPCIVSL